MIIFPYIRSIMNKIVQCNIVDKSKTMIGYRCLHKLDKFIKTYKDKKQHLDNNNVIYKINAMIVMSLMSDKRRDSSELE